MLIAVMSPARVREYMSWMREIMYLWRMSFSLKAMLRILQLVVILIQAATALKVLRGKISLHGVL
jgi:hypothetical protein